MTAVPAFGARANIQYKPQTRSAFDYDFWRCPSALLLLDAGANTGRNLTIDFRLRAVGLSGDDRQARVRSFTDVHDERHFAQKRHTEPLGFLPCTAMGENIRPLAAMRTDKIAHVLDDAEHRHIDLAEHGNAAPRIDERKILRGRYNDRARKRHLLGESQLR